MANKVICSGYWNHPVLVMACTVMPLTAAPVWLASVPLTWTVEFGPAVVGVIAVMAMVSARC